MFENRMKFVLSAVVVLSLALAFAPSAFATTTATATFNVTTSVTNTCTISATGLTFAAYNPANATPDAGTATLTINCTNYANYSVALNGGGSGSVTARKMTNGTYSLGYLLCTTVGCGTIWGDGTGSTVAQTGTGTGANQTLTVYGQIPINEAAISGSYSDTVTATITY